MLSRTEHKRGWFTLTRQVIVFTSIFLMALPWLGYRYMDEMREYLLRGQGDAQQLAAQAVATVLHDRSDLIGLASPPVSLLPSDAEIYVYPLDAGIALDGYGGDWGDLLLRRRSYDRQGLVYDRTQGAYAHVSFDLVLGEDDRYIMGFLAVRDDRIVFRHPGYARLDSSDHVRIELRDVDGQIRRYALFAEAPGTVSVYEMRPDWMRALTGKPLYTMGGVWRDRPYGYDLEFRIPAAWFDEGQSLMLSVADVDSEIERRIDNVVATLGDSEGGALNRLIKRSPGIERIIKGLGHADTSICIVDSARRVRALTGNSDESGAVCSMTDRVAPELVTAALDGRGEVTRAVRNSGRETVVASHPIYIAGDIAGVVLVEKGSDEILGDQRRTLVRVILATAVVFVIALTGLLLFSGILTFRLRRLQREISASIDDDGRLLSSGINASRGSGDELGELSRRFSGLLSQLNSYMGFLESVPRTLRHEILNPLNTISMTMQKLSASREYDDALVNSAQNATHHLEIIVQSLTEAAHIDDALIQQEQEPVDLAELLPEYIDNIRSKHPGNGFSYTGPGGPLMIMGSDIRITQMLDKLKDNAIDFAEPGSEIEFSLGSDDGMVKISVCNRGPLIPDDVAGFLGKGIISRRQKTLGEPHLGIGLYVASRIAQHHGGKLVISNRPDGSGVCITISMHSKASKSRATPRSVANSTGSPRAR